MNSFKKIGSLFLIVFLFIASVSIYAQNNKTGAPVLIKGHITDEFSGKPLGVSVEFRVKDGEKVKIQSNSIDGSFQQIVNSGDTVEIIFSSKEIVRKSETIAVERYSNYKEIIHDFQVKKLSPGLHLFTILAFNEKSSQLNSTAQNLFNQLQDIMLFNRNVKFEIVINANDLYTKPQSTTEISKQTDAKSKKKAKQPQETPKQTNIEPSANEIQSIVDKRVAEVEKIVKEWNRYKNRVKVKADYSLDKSNETQTSPQKTNLVVVVTDMKSVLE